MWFVSNVPQQSRFFVSEIFRIQVTFEQESLVFRETEENVSRNILFCFAKQKRMFRERKKMRKNAKENLSADNV